MSGLPGLSTDCRYSTGQRSRASLAGTLQNAFTFFDLCVVIKGLELKEEVSLNCITLWVTVQPEGNHLPTGACCESQIK